jgi:hypothetical protein
MAQILKILFKYNLMNMACILDVIHHITMLHNHCILSEAWISGAYLTFMIQTLGALRSVQFKRTRYMLLCGQLEW